MKPASVSLAGKVALITGAGSGLGAATALLFASCGARVGLIDRRRERLRGVHAEIRRRGGEALVLPADVTRPADLRKAVASLGRAWGRLDIVFANAGVNGTRAPVGELTVREWSEPLAVNLTGAFLTVRAALPWLKRTGGGSIVLTSSVVGNRMFSQVGASAYAASKAGLAAFGRLIALELARDRIRVNTVCPGVFASNLMAETRARHTRRLCLPVIFPRGHVPLTGGEPADAEAIARAVLYLASDIADHVTGTELYVDGGQSLLVG